MANEGDDGVIWVCGYLPEEPPLYGIIVIIFQGLSGYQSQKRLLTPMFREAPVMKYEGIVARIGKL